jgi:hypothetical protein
VEGIGRGSKLERRDGIGDRAGNGGANAGGDENLQLGMALEQRGHSCDGILDTVDSVDHQE